MVTHAGFPANTRGHHATTRADVISALECFWCNHTNVHVQAQLPSWVVLRAGGLETPARRTLPGSVAVRVVWH